MRSGSSSKRFRGRPEIHWPQKRRAAIRVESVETRDCVSALNADEHGAEHQADENDVEELRFVPSAVSEPRWALHMCDDKCGKEGFTFFTAAAVVSEEGGAADTLNLCSKGVTTKGDWSKAKKRWRCHFRTRIGGMLSTIDLAAGAPPWCQHHATCQQTSLLAVANLGSETASPGPDSRCTRLETPSTEEEVNCAATLHRRRSELCSWHTKVADPTSEESQTSNRDPFPVRRREPTSATQARHSHLPSTPEGSRVLP